MDFLINFLEYVTTSEIKYSYLMIYRFLPHPVYAAPSTAHTVSTNETKPWENYPLAWYIIDLRIVCRHMFRKDWRIRKYLDTLLHVSNYKWTRNNRLEPLGFPQLFVCNFVNAILVANLSCAVGSQMNRRQYLNEYPDLLRMEIKIIQSRPICKG